MKTTAMAAAGFRDIVLHRCRVGRLLAVSVVGGKPGTGDAPTLRRE